MVDVDLMKLDALITRGSRKDFFDLYVIAQEVSIPDLLAMARSKCPQRNSCAISGKIVLEPKFFV